MAVTCLTKVIYDDARSWHSEKITAPTWEDVEVSIRCLDKFYYPWALLFIGDDHDDMTADCLRVMGGEGVWWVSLCAGKYDQLRLFDANKGSQEVQLWTSDQGFADYEFHVTDDIQLVLRIAKYFAET